MSDQIVAIAQRLRGLREIMEISQQEMAETLGVDVSVYDEYEQGMHDFAFSFLYGCANKLGVDIIELLTGEAPRLSYCSIVRRDEGLEIERRSEYKYQHLAYFFKNKKAEPFHVTVTPEDQSLHLNAHDGQEFNYILKGSMLIKVGEEEAIVNEGDAIYYDSSKPHGMIAVNNAPCEFLAVIMK